MGVATNFVVTPASAQDCMGVILGSPPGTLHPIVPVCPPNGFPDQAPDVVGAPLP